ncbi:MBL fold metallo-hydrolase [Ruania zhangjianzhongii]|uniref:MBL fold metallo-hydrolase n=1 Tax=Ruania zhangjianzhongii TaxID=2603206 RepID=UPI0011C862D6|nr:MBL fold metallo-hydrolase [Ruania zhangjianzhongii]
MPDPVKQLSVLECGSAAAGMLRGAILPRRPDRRLLASIADAGLPEADGTVSVRALAQVSRAIPTAAAVEGTFMPRRVGSALTAFVIEHPQARFIVDPGVCLDVEERAIAELPRVLQMVVRPRPRPVPTLTALHQAGAGALDFALPTHAHWDHVCGVLDLPGLPVYLHRIEHQWINSGPVAPAGGVRDALRDRSIVEFDLDGPPVLTFTASHDLFGDGTVVLVDLAGHTPGSIGILAQTRSGRVLLAGDAAWHSLQIEKIRQKASFPGNFVDHDREATFRMLHRLHLASQTVTVVPTHDHAAVQPLSDRQEPPSPSRTDPRAERRAHRRRSPRSVR